MPRPSARHPLPSIREELRPQQRLILRRYRIGPADAEDLLQSALAQALSKWEEIRDWARSVPFLLFLL